MFRFIHAADIHLDSPLRGLEQYEGAPVDEIRSATRRALENLVELAMGQNVDFVLIAGDLYDGDWKDHNTGLFFARQMLRLRDADIPVIAIRGNHDAENRMTKTLRLPENVQLLSHSAPQTCTSKRLKEIGVAIHGRSFAKPAEFENLALDYPDATPGYFNIGLLHTSLAGAEGHQPYAPCSLNDLRSKQYDYWALGHVHNRMILDDDPPIVFPGNLQGRHIRETGEKGCMLVSVDEKGACQLDFHALDVFRWENCLVDAAGAESGNQVLERVAAKISEQFHAHAGIPLAVRVTVDGFCRVHDQLAADAVGWTNEIRNVALEIGGGSVWVENVKWRTSTVRELDAAALAGGPFGELSAFIDELRADERSLQELSSEFDDLRRKIPDELKRGDDAVSFDNPQQLLELLEQVHPLLIGRLMEHAEP